MLDTESALVGVKSAPILVVDDEETVAAALKETILSGGFEVNAFTDPLKALASLGEQTYSVILTDQKMPGLTGSEFLERARKLQPNATRILVTGLLKLDTVIDAINRGEIFRFLVKPWYREELLATLHNAVQRYDLVRRNEELRARTLAMNRELMLQVEYIGDQNDSLLKANQALQQNLERSIELCLHMLEAFLPQLGSQAHRVHRLCRTMAEVMHLEEKPAKALETAAWLHDIGLIAVPRSLVRRWRLKPESLIEPELVILQHHPLLGETLANFARPFEGVGQAIRTHHERFDGKGYPDRLEGDRIPWLGRLLAVAVGYASSSLDSGSAVEYIKFGSGTLFDPEAVRVFLSALPRASVPHQQTEIPLAELKPGMRLARGVYNSNGMLLVPEGQRLTETSIEKLLNHSKVSPMEPRLLIYG